LTQHTELKKVLLDARADLAGLIAQDPATRGKLRIDFSGDDSDGIYRQLKDEPQGGTARLATLWIDDLQALRAAVEEMRDARPDRRTAERLRARAQRPRHRRDGRRDARARRPRPQRALPERQPG
jgi:hypothetical protein